MAEKSGFRDILWTSTSQARGSSPWCMGLGAPGGLRRGTSPKEKKRKKKNDVTEKLTRNDHGMPPNFFL